MVGCVQCHLPPSGVAHFFAKITTGGRDVMGMVLKDAGEIDWQAKSQREQAERYVYKSACLHCHQNLFPRGLSRKGEDAHLHYDRNAAALRCINCHLQTGHAQETAAAVTTAGEAGEPATPDTIYKSAAEINSFASFTETIPGTSVSFEMIAVPGGEFMIGSPNEEPYRNPDEGPQRRVRISPFWMGKTEVSWREYEAFYAETASEGRSEDQILPEKWKGNDSIDALTGPTPAYGNPDQGWGRGDRPAITMTHFAAQRYCEWLSQKTGKKYRLPTEAEWEYACRGGTQSAYFFPGAPVDFQTDRLWNKLFGSKKEPIEMFVVYGSNSGGRSQPPVRVQPNPFGLLNMLGNVWEFCSDWYAAGAYGQYPAGEVVMDPKGPASGEEHVLRGGSFRSDAAEVRVANRSHTQRAYWQRTDPQMPKSKWWYSDCIDVGFRVVCEFIEMQGGVK